MDQWTHLILTVIGSVAASSGFWAFMMKRAECKDTSKLMLLGLGHDRIMYLGMCYIERGWISKDEFENLNDYLYVPYTKMNGNGSAERIMQEVRKLPIRTYKGAMEVNEHAII